MYKIFVFAQESSLSHLETTYNKFSIFYFSYSSNGIFSNSFGTLPSGKFDALTPAIYYNIFYYILLNLDLI